MSQCVALTHLDLSDNNLTVEGVAALVSALLQPGSRLRDLRLANNWFGPAGVRALTRPLVSNMGLQYLDVSNTSARPADAIIGSAYRAMMMWSADEFKHLDSDQHTLQTLAGALRVCLIRHLRTLFEIKKCAYWLLIIQVLFSSSLFFSWADQHATARSRRVVFGRDIGRPVRRGAGANAA